MPLPGERNQGFQGDEPRRPLAEVYADIATQYEPYALKLTGYALNHDVTIFTGTPGIGKSAILIPRAIEILGGNGYETLYFDFDTEHKKLYNRWEIVDRHPHDDRGVLIIDEAQWLYNAPNQTDRLHAITHSLSMGWNVMASFSYTPRLANQVEEVISVWQSAMKSDIAVLHLPAFRLDRPLAKELFAAQRNDHGLPPLPDELLEYLLDCIPYHRRLIDLLAWNSMQSIEEVRRAISKEVKGFSVGLNADELTDVFINKRI